MPSSRATGRKAGSRRFVVPRGFTLLLLILFISSFSQTSAAKTDALKLYLEGKYEESRLATLGELAADPRNIEAYVVLCWDLLALRRWADAENYALKASAIREDIRIVEVLGESAYMLGRNETALRHFQNYVSALPEGARVGFAYYFMGEIYIRMARYAHADIAFSTALQFTPENAPWWSRLGWAREKAGDAQAALKAYKEAIRLDPHLEDAALGRDRIEARLRG